MINLQGKKALVTGASRGIGRACALKLAECGADVAVNFLASESGAAEVTAKIQATGRRSLAIRADVSDRDDVIGMVDATVERLGGLDIIVSNAAAGGFRPLIDVSPPNWDSVLRHNAAPLVWLAQAALKSLTASSCGRLIAMSSHGSIRAVANYGMIGASKAALESLVRQLAFELGPKGINVNAVMPGMVSTDAVKSMPGVEGVLRGAQARMLVARQELRPEDVAGVVAFLASPLAEMIQGQTIIVDGGVSIQV